MFSTAEDTKQVEPLPDSDAPIADDAEKKFVPVSFHDEVLARAESKLGIKLVKRSRASFEEPDLHIALICLASRVHERGAFPSYWFAYHTHQRDFLLSQQHGYLALGCGSASNVLLIPASELEKWIDGMNRTKTDSRDYWHLQKWFLIRRSGQPKIDLSKHVLRERSE